MLHRSYSLLLSFLAKTLNQSIAQSISSQNLIKPLNNKVIGIEIKGLKKNVFVRFEDTMLSLLESYEGIVDVHLSGTPLALLSLKKPHSNATFSGEVKISGDLNITQRLQALLASLDIDIEEIISRYIGDIPAHQLGRVVKSVGKWLKDTHYTLELNTVEFLKYEINLLPEREETSRLLSQIDILRSDADRLEARINRLRNRLKPQ